MPLSASYDRLFAPILAIGLVLIIAAISRWVWTPARAARRDYGLLVPAAAVADLARAQAARARLAEHGIRATLGIEPGLVRVSPEGRAVHQQALHQVLVFPQDLDRAVQLLG